MIFSGIFEPNELGSPHAKILLNRFLRLLFNAVLAFRNEQNKTIIERQDSDYKLDKDEENVLRYVAGYVPFSILKKLELRKPGPTKDSLLLVLHSWSKEQGGEHLTFLNYTRHWVEKQNRGGR